MKFERSRGFLAQTLGALAISAILAGCGGSTVSDVPESDANSSSSPSAATADSVTLSWSAPTENTNGTALTNLSGYIIYYGTSAGAMTQTINVNTVGMLTYVVGNLSPGSWYFQIVAVNSAGEQSNPSSTVSASI
jgi:ABC-type glycerol-3-phosphate transport system substrate-binding protein